MEINTFHFRTSMNQGGGGVFFRNVQYIFMRPMKELFHVIYRLSVGFFVVFLFYFIFYGVSNTLFFSYTKIVGLKICRAPSFLAVHPAFLTWVHACT